MGSEHIEIQTLLNELARRIEIGHALPLFINSYVITMNVISLAGNVSMTGTELSSALYSLKSMGGGKSINFNWQRWKKSGQVRCCTKHTAVCSQMLIAYIYKSNDAFTVKNSTALPDTLSQDRSSTSPYHFRQVMQSWKSSNPYPATVNGARNPKTRVSDGNPLQVSRCWSDVHIHSFKFSANRTTMRRKRKKKIVGRILVWTAMRISYSAAPAADIAFPLHYCASCPVSIDRWQCPVTHHLFRFNWCSLLQEKRKYHLSGPLVTTALFGLQGITADYPVVRSIFSQSHKYWLKCN